jgi:hypothetical protein
MRPSRTFVVQAVSSPPIRASDLLRRQLNSQDDIMDLNYTPKSRPSREVCAFAIPSCLPRSACKVLEHQAPHER